MNLDPMWRSRPQYVPGLDCKGRPILDICTVIVRIIVRLSPT